LHITYITAGLSGLLLFLLSWRVIQIRRRAKISLGDGGDSRLLARIRAHGNFAEYVPVCLILIGLIEYRTGPSTPLWVLGLGLIAVRIAHLIGMDLPAGNAFRMVGTGGTFLVLILLSAWTLFLGV
jgi:uncharacterized membrane protein YecN with MAPEG domain